MLHALWRPYNVSAPPSVIDEPELDMNRHEPQSPGSKPRRHSVWGWFGKGGGAMGSPRRSVDRELQEDWPTQYY